MELQALMTAKEVANFLCLDERVIWQRAKREGDTLAQICVRDGRNVRFNRADIETLFGPRLPKPANTNPTDLTVPNSVLAGGSVQAPGASLTSHPGIQAKKPSLDADAGAFPSHPNTPKDGAEALPTSAQSDPLTEAQAND